MLRIHDGRVFGAEPKERGVEHFDAVEHGRRLDIVGAGDSVGRGAGCQQFGVGKCADRFRTIAQVVPELVIFRAPGKRPAIPTMAIAEFFMPMLAGRALCARRSPRFES